MKETIQVFDYAGQITKALPRGILLNTQGEKFNSMVIGWGHLGVIWGKPTFTVYVREHRYTKAQLDKAREFTLSIPLEKPDSEINRVCGFESGRNVDKAKKAGLTLVPAQRIATLSPHVKTDVYDLNHFPALREQYDVMSVPCFVIGDNAPRRYAAAATPKKWKGTRPLPTATRTPPTSPRSKTPTS